MVITECAVGTEVRLTGHDFDESLCLRFRELGLGTGARARIVQRAAFGGRVIAIAGQRIALDAGTAGRISVEIESAPERVRGRQPRSESFRPMTASSM